MLLDKIDDLLKEVSQLSAKNAEDLEKLRIKYLRVRMTLIAIESYILQKQTLIKKHLRDYIN